VNLSHYRLGGQIQLKSRSHQTRCVPSRHDALTHFDASTRVDATTFGHLWHYFTVLTREKSKSRKSNKFDFDTTRRVRCERSLSLTLVWFNLLTRVEALGVNGALACNAGTSPVWLPINQRLLIPLYIYSTPTVLVTDETRRYSYTSNPRRIAVVNKHWHDSSINIGAIVISVKNAVVDPATLVLSAPKPHLF